MTPSTPSEMQERECLCGRPHYPLEFFRQDDLVIATRGTRPVRNVLADGWVRTTLDPRTERRLREQYNRSHRFDWLHTPTYLDDKETHLRMKQETAR